MIKTHKDLIVWQKSMELVLLVYQLTSVFPKQETFALKSQMQRAAVSIPSNIAEGRSRGSRKDFVQFLRIAHGSGSELQTQLEIAEKLSFGRKTDYNKAQDLLNEVLRMLAGMIAKLKAPPSQLHPSS